MKIKKCNVITEEFTLKREPFNQDSKLYNIRRRKKFYYKFELIQDNYFPDGITDSDIFYEETKFVPYGFFVFFTDKKSHPKECIKKIFIRTLISEIYKGNLTQDDLNRKQEINKDFRLYKLLTPNFWEEIGVDLLYKEFSIERHISELLFRKEFGSCRVFDFNSEIYENVWNEFCLTEGKTHIERDSFLLWLYRLNSVSYDLINYPFLNTNYYQWNNRYLFIRELLRQKETKHYEYYCEHNWNDLLKKRFTREMALASRINDAKDLLNDFFKQIEPVSALEKFLISFYESFGEKLCEDNLLSRCHFCNEFINYQQGKLYCSLLVEGKNCGKKARNKRYYEKRGKKNLRYNRKLWI